MDQQITNIVNWFKHHYLDGVPLLIRDETAFLSFICILAGVEALGGYYDPAASGLGANGQRFRQFVTKYFPSPYQPNASKLWDFRNGMAHGFSPRQFALTHHNSSVHFRQTNDGAIILNAEDFYTAFLTASNAYFADLSASTDLQTKFLSRIASQQGGSFTVGFVDVI